MKKFTLTFLLFLSIIFSIFYLLDSYYTNYFLSHKNLCEKSEWILNQKNGNYDFAFIGNSRVINMVDIDIIEKKTGKKCINLGLTGAGNAECLLAFDQFVKNNNQVKKLFIQVDMHSLNSKKEVPYPFHEYNYVFLLHDSMANSIFKENVAKHDFLMWKYVPFTRYMRFSNRFVLYKVLKGGFECKTSDFDITKGSEINDKETHQPFDKKYNYWYVNKSDKVYLDKLVKFASDKGIEVVLFTAPIWSNYFKYQLNAKDIFKELKFSCDSSGIRYINFIGKNDSLCNDRSNYNDNVHMNSKGSARFSSALADSLNRF